MSVASEYTLKVRNCLTRAWPAGVLRTKYERAKGKSNKFIKRRSFSNFLDEQEIGINNMIKTYNDLLKKVSDFKIDQDIDLSAGEDLSIGIMNLISIEEHLFFTYNKTKSPKYLDLLDEVRKMRTELLRDIIKDYEGEVWCISKHLLAASMRVMEVGTKELKKGNKKKASELFQKSYKLYTLFWGLNLSKNSNVSKKADNLEFLDEKGNKNGSASVFSKLGALAQKALDCCRE